MIKDAPDGTMTPIGRCAFVAVRAGFEIREDCQRLGESDMI